MTPRPAYSALTPPARYMALNVCTNVDPWAPDGRNSASVCIALFTVSAGKNAMLNEAPAQAPDSADSHGKGVVAFRLAMSNEATYSLEPNQAIAPPTSRMNVPVCPSHRPLNPVWRMVDIRMDMGPGRGPMEVPGATSI